MCGDAVAPARIREPRAGKLVKLGHFEEVKVVTRLSWLKDSEGVMGIVGAAASGRGIALKVSLFVRSVYPVRSHESLAAASAFL